MSGPVLKFQQVTRRFGSTVALDGLDLKLEPGTVLGLIGRNGAGKSTSLRLALGHLHPDAGSILVLGHDPVTEGIKVREQVGLMSEEASLYGWMTVTEIMNFAAGLHPNWDPALAESFRKRLDLDPAKKIKNLSRGNKAKVSLVLAVAVRPRLLLLDDPTSGLDPLVRREVLEGVLESVPAEGGAVVYASHLIHDVERIADQVTVLDEGQSILEGDLEKIKERVRRVVAVFEGEPPQVPSLPGLVSLGRDNRTLSVVADGANGELEQVLHQAGAINVTVEPLPLEEILVACLKGSGREEGDNHA
jgi:ABC-2 type transport system ATP-binding protein